MLLRSLESANSFVNPFGTLNKGWRQVTKALDQVSSQVREGEIIFETLLTYVTPELAFIVEVDQMVSRSVRPVESIIQKAI